ncbi:PTS sugar transporter subunit IIA [Enterococcus termitis]
MNTKEMFQPKLIDLQVSVQNEEELFELIAARLQKEGYVNDGYLAGIKAREKEFPTGLITEYLNIALPHSDTEYIERLSYILLEQQMRSKSNRWATIKKWR